MVPTDRPVHALAAVLMPFLEPDMTETDRLIETNKLAEALLSRTIKLREVADRVLAKQPGTDRLQLENERLLVTSQCAGGGEETIEVSHEALIRHWDRLKGWVDADRRFLLWQQRLHILVDQYEESHKSADLLLRGFPLTEALEWVKNKPDSFSVRECQFVTASKNRKERNRSVAGLITGLILESSVRAGCGKMVIPLIRHSSKSSMVFL